MIADWAVLSDHTHDSGSVHRNLGHVPEQHIARIDQIVLSMLLAPYLIG
jgi:hypothetical protein